MLEKGVINISVIVPVYNTSARLDACLDSLLNQMQSGVEIILVDDGSTDGSLVIEHRYQQAHPDKIRLFESAHGGVSAARNTGLDAARGEWIGFCDSDDTVDPRIYAELYSAALKSGAELSCCKMLDKGPEESMVISNFPFSGYTLLTDRAVIIKELFLELLLNTKRCNGYLMTCLYRRDILDRFNIRFNTGITMQEDEIFLLNYLLRVNCIVGIDMILYNYLRFETSACFNYYRRESDYFRERNWYALSLAQRDVFRNSGLDGTYSWIGSLLTFKVYFHEVQMVCSSPELRYFERLKKLRKISGRARGEKLNLKGGHRLFWQVLIYMPGLLPLLCFLKRRKDQCSRKVEHWLKGVFR